MNTDCRWWLCRTPTGPSQPFSGDVIFYDLLRIVTVAAIAVTVVFSLYLVVTRRTGAIGQAVRFLGASGLAIYAAAGTVEHFGDAANWRLIILVPSTLAMAWGVYAAVFLERPAQPGRYDRPRAVS